MKGHRHWFVTEIKTDLNDWFLWWSRNGDTLPDFENDSWTKKLINSFIIICLILGCITAFLFFSEPYVESAHFVRLVMLDIIENKKFDKSEIISCSSHHCQHQEVSGSFISYLQRAVCGGLVSPVCKKPISLFHRSSSATSCCALARRTHLTV